MDSRDEFYITTPIYYVNDKPHIGHAYTTIVADTLARWRAARGEHVVFSTGADENAQKTVDAAKKNGEEIRAYTDRLAEIWELDVGRSSASRTLISSAPRRSGTSKWSRISGAAWKRRAISIKDSTKDCIARGTRRSMKEDELTPDGLCPDHKTKPELVTEENYFFRLIELSAAACLDFYEAHGEFVAPAHRFNEVRAFVEHGLGRHQFFARKKRVGDPGAERSEPGHLCMGGRARQLYFHRRR